MNVVVACVAAQEAHQIVVVGLRNSVKSESAGHRCPFIDAHERAYLHYFLQYKCVGGAIDTVVGKG